MKTLCYLTSVMVVLVIASSFNGCTQNQDDPSPVVEMEFDSKNWDLDLDIDFSKDNVAVPASGTSALSITPVHHTDQLIDDLPGDIFDATFPDHLSTGYGGDEDVFMEASFDGPFPVDSNSINAFGAILIHAPGYTPTSENPSSGWECVTCTSEQCVIDALANAVGDGQRDVDVKIKVQRKLFVRVDVQISWRYLAE